MNQAVYQHLLATYGRNPGQWLGMATEVIRTLMLRIGTPLVLAQVAVAVSRGNIELATRYVLYFLLLQVIGSLIGAAGELIAIRAENKSYEESLVSFHAKLTGKDMAFYRDHQTGYLASAFRQHLDASLEFVRFLRNEIIKNGLSLTVPTLVLLVVDWKIGLVAIVVVIIQLAYIAWSSKKADVYRSVSHEIYRKLTGEVSDEITNIVAFKSAGVETEAHSKVARLAHKETATFWLRRKTTTLLDLPRGLITGVGVATAFYVLLHGSSAGPETIGVLVLTLTYMFQIMRNVSDLPNMMVKHDDLITKLHPTLHYLTSDYETIEDPVTPQELVITRGVITIEHVHFGYAPYHGSDTKISLFEDLHITIQGGEQVGMVGLSGAGKSTFASLLMRFDDVDSGAIKIDGTDIRGVRQSDLRKNIAYVPQEPLLFHRTIRENIAYFKDNVSEAAIKRAAEAAHAHEFIKTMPQQYETLVGERGVKLSGGQKQRVAIARAILKNAPIMIFDEATSALDSESEQIIQRALPEIIGKQTAIVIAHRLSTVANLDRIIVMQHGKVIEEGSHDELLQLGGQYYSLWQKQTKNAQRKIT